MTKTQANTAHDQAEKSYRVTRPEGYDGAFGISYPDPHKEGEEKYAKEGAVVHDLPPGSIHWLLKDGMIEPIEKAGGNK